MVISIKQLFDSVDRHSVYQSVIDFIEETHFYSQLTTVMFVISVLY